MSFPLVAKCWFCKFVEYSVAGRECSFCSKPRIPAQGEGTNDERRGDSESENAYRMRVFGTVSQ